MKFYSLLAFVLAIGTLGACSKHGNGSYVTSAQDDASILGAKKVNLWESWFAPSVVQLQTFTMEKPGQVSISECTATLIGERVALTAAHCLKSVIGKKLNASAVNGETGQIINGEVPISIITSPLWPNFAYGVSEFVVHENYDPKGLHRADIALLKLARPLLAKHRPQKSHAQISIDGPSAIAPGTALLAIGFGINEISHGIFGFGETQKKDGLYQKIVEAIDPSRITGFGESDKILINARAGDPAGNVCQGDSGGPLLKRLSGLQYSIVGVFAQSENGCVGMASATEVSRFSSWLKKHIKAWNLTLFH